jgi:hypothetical protein
MNYGYLSCDVMNICSGRVSFLWIIGPDDGSEWYFFVHEEKPIISSDRATGLPGDDTMDVFPPGHDQHPG